MSQVGIAHLPPAELTSPHPALKGVEFIHGRERRAPP
jgi:hypothetical protein